MRKGCSAWWKNHGHLSSIKCSPIGQGNFTNFHELGKPVLPLFPTRATIPPPLLAPFSPQGCTSVSHQYVTVQTSAPAQWGPCARSICALDGNEPTKGRSKRNHCASKCRQRRLWPVKNSSSNLCLNCERERERERLCHCSFRSS